LLRFVEFTRLQRMGFTVFGLREIEEDNMRMQLRCGIGVYRPGAVVLVEKAGPRICLSLAGTKARRRLYKTI